MLLSNREWKIGSLPQEVTVDGSINTCGKQYKPQVCKQSC